MKINITRKIVLKLMAITTIIIIISSFVLYRSIAYNNSKIKASSINIGQIIDTTTIIDELPMSVTENMRKNNIDIIYKFYNGSMESQNKVSAMFSNTSGVSVQLYTISKSSLADYISIGQPLVYKYNLQIDTLYLVGFLFDTKNNHYSNSKEFMNITKEESKKICNSKEFADDYKGYENKPRTYFGQSFAFYFANNETRDFLQAQAPKTFNYIKNITSK